MTEIEYSTIRTVAFLESALSSLRAARDYGLLRNSSEDAITEIALQVDVLRSVSLKIGSD